MTPLGISTLKRVSLPSTVRMGSEHIEWGMAHFSILSSILFTCLFCWFVNAVPVRRDGNYGTMYSKRQLAYFSTLNDAVVHAFIPLSTVDTTALFFGASRMGKWKCFWWKSWNKKDSVILGWLMTLAHGMLTKIDLFFVDLDCEHTVSSATFECFIS